MKSSQHIPYTTEVNVDIDGHSVMGRETVNKICRISSQMVQFCTWQVTWPKTSHWACQEHRKCPLSMLNPPNCSTSCHKILKDQSFSGADFVTLASMADQASQGPRFFRFYIHFLRNVAVLGVGAAPRGWCLLYGNRGNFSIPCWRQYVSLFSPIAATVSLFLTSNRRSSHWSCVYLQVVVPPSCKCKSGVNVFPELL